MSLVDLFAGARRDGAVLHFESPDSWMQGRTLYGGLTAALALEAARGVDADLPPLRSAQIAFIGPLSGPVSVEAKLLRRGRNAAFVTADVRAGDTLGVRAMFVLMSNLQSAIDHTDVAPPPTTIALDAAEPARPRGAGKFFTDNFEFRHARGQDSEPEFLRWARLRERDGVDPAVEVLAAADALPPAAMPLFGAPAPISTMTWQINMLTAAPQSDDGWWLLRARADYTRNGCSSQFMHIWNARGEPIAQAIQSVAIFA